VETVGPNAIQPTRRPLLAQDRYHRSCPAPFSQDALDAPLHLVSQFVDPESHNLPPGTPDRNVTPEVVAPSGPVWLEMKSRSIDLDIDGDLSIRGKCEIKASPK